MRIEATAASGLAVGSAGSTTAGLTVLVSPPQG